MTRQERPKTPEPRRLSDSQMWDRMAAWWNEKQGEEGDLWHRLLIESPFERVIGDVGDCASWRSPAATAASPGVWRDAAQPSQPWTPPKG